MKQFFKRLQRVEDWVVILSFSVMILACFVQVVNRNIFKIPVIGFEEASRYSMIYMVLLGTEMGLRDGTQISVTAVQDKLTGKARKLLLLVSKLIVVGFSGFMFYESIGMVQSQIRSGQKSPGLQIPMTIPYMALLISFFLITAVQAYSLYCQVRDFNRPDGPELAKGGADQ